MALRKLGLSGVVAALVMAAMPASAATLTFNLTGNDTKLYGDYGNVRTFSATAGGKTVNVQVSAWTAYAKQGGGYTVESSYLGAYSHGLGVTNSKDDKGKNLYHTIDNKNGYDFVVFRFDQDVDVSSLTFSPFKVDGSTDSDAWIGVGQTDVNYSSALSFSNWANDMSMFDTIFESAGGSKESTRNDINPSNEIGNLLFVGASMKSFGRNDSWDGFKLRSLTVDTVKAPPPPPAVPEPATWAMMLAGFGLVGGAMRHRTRRPVMA